MLVIVAVGCLLLSLACGCIDAWWTTTVVALRIGGDMENTIRIQMESQFEQAKDQALKRAATPEEREKISRGFDVLMREGVPQAVSRGIKVAMDSPASSSLQTLGLLGVAAHVAMFVAGIMLFLRRPAAKWVGIIACVMIIGLNAATAAALQDVAGAFFGEVTPVLEQAARDSGESLDADVAAIPKAVRIGVTVVTLSGALMMSVWPLIAALILGFSRSIARDLSAARTQTN